MAVAAQLKEPTLAVVPKISVTTWKNVAKYFGEPISVTSLETLRTGRSGFGSWDNTPPPGFRNETFFKCLSCQREVSFQNFEPCYVHPNGIHCVETKKKAWKYGHFHFHPGIRRLIIDEAHRCSATDSLNADMVIGAANQSVPMLLASATLAGSPLHLRALGYALGLHGLSDFYPWSRKFKCGTIDGLRGWHWKAGRDEQVKVMQQINGLLIPARGVRVRTADIPNFPKRVVSSELYDIENDLSLDELYEDLRNAMADLESRRATDKDSEHPLTLCLRINQALELRKVPLMVELAKASVERGNSVGLFIRYAATMSALRRLLKCDCFIDGTQTTKQRDGCIAKFQSDEARIILVNTEAGGISVSLHDLVGNHPRDGYLPPGISARSFMQLLGRFNRDGGLTTSFYKVILAAGTCEEKIHAKLQSKLANLNALNDGNLTDEDFLPFD